MVFDFKLKPCLIDITYNTSKTYAVLAFINSNTITLSIEWSIYNLQDELIKTIIIKNEHKSGEKGIELFSNGYIKNIELLNSNLDFISLFK